MLLITIKMAKTMKIKDAGIILGYGSVVSSNAFQQSVFKFSNFGFFVGSSV